MKVLRYPIRNAVLICCLMLSWAALRAQSNERIFRAGASLSNVTPFLGEEIVGNWNSPPATHVHDQLHVRSLVLDDGSTRLAIVLVDNVGVNREVFDAAKKLIHRETGLPMSHMLMAATHTHSGTSAGGQGEKRRGWHPDQLDDYQKFLARRISDGVRTAINNLEPARIAWGSCSIPEHVFNRRWVMKNPVVSPLGLKDKVRMNPGHENPDLVEPAGPTDPEMAFVALESRGGRPIALLGNYSLHYVGGVPEGHISADYFAVFGERIEDLLEAERQDPPFVGMLSNGTSGDINNIDFSKGREQRKSYEKMRYVASDMAEKVFRAYGDLRFRDWVALGAAQSELTLNVRRASPEVLKNMEAVRKRADAAEPLFHPLEKTYAARIRQMEREWPDQVTVLLQAFRIGELGIAAIPFEVFAETGLEIKAKSPFEQSFTIELANGSYGYLPTPRQHALGGYETWLSTNKVQPDASVRIVGELMTLLNGLK